MAFKCLKDMSLSQTIPTAKSNSLAHTYLFNAATSTAGTVNNYTRTVGGQVQNWRSHVFTGTGTFTALSIDNPFEVLVLQGGQGGPYSHPADIRNYSGASGVAKTQLLSTIPLGNTTITVGGGGGGGAQVHQDGSAGGHSTIGGLLSSSGGGSVSTDIRAGTSETWAGNGYGGGGGPCYLCTGGTGQAGIAIVSYRTS